MVFNKNYLKCIIETIKVLAITEDENEISLRDANSSRERPKLDGFDMDQDTVSEIEVLYIFMAITFKLAIQRRIFIQRWCCKTYGYHY